MSQSEKPVTLILLRIVRTYDLHLSIPAPAQMNAKTKRRTYAALVAQFRNIQKYPTFILEMTPLMVDKPLAASATAGSPATRASLISAQAAIMEEITLGEELWLT